jgi:DNA-binding PadR family transcriptional regulator
METTVLGDLEQIVLLAVLRLGADAYGVTIAEELRERAGRDVTLATIYKTLERLEVKGYVRTSLGEPTPVRGGRAKRYYGLTPGGRRVLQETLKVLDRMTRDIDLKWQT